MGMRRPASLVGGRFGSGAAQCHVIPCTFVIEHGTNEPGDFD
jgi:hypothetical protein